MLNSELLMMNVAPLGETLKMFSLISFQSC